MKKKASSQGVGVHTPCRPPRSASGPNIEKAIKYDVQRTIYDEIQGVWIAHETLVTSVSSV